MDDFTLPIGLAGCCSSPRRLLVVSDSRVKPSAVVAEFDVLHDITSGVFQGRVLRAVDPFDFHRGVE